MTMPSTTAVLAALAAGEFAVAHAPATRIAARRHLLDTTGAIIAGMRQPVAVRAAALHGRLIADGKVMVPGQARGWDALTAAYLMGTAAHGLELDDGYTQGSVHPGATVVPALLAAVQIRPVSGAQLLTAMAVGYELVARLATAVHPASRRRGFHNTAIVGPLAAAGAVGAMFGMNAAMIEHALGIAASSASGLFAFLHSGGDTKRLHAGHAAREGLLAALMAEEGMQGPAGVVESKDGFLHAFGDPATVRAGIDPMAPAAITRCYVKPWACCRHIHPAIDGLLDMMRSDGISAANVATIDVDTYAIGTMHGDTGWDDLLSAQMSYPYALAVTLARGHIDLDDFGDSARADPAILSLCDRIHVRTDAAFDAIYPRARMARIRVMTAAGRVHERTVDDGYGSPAHPMSDEALARKFDGLVTPVLGAAGAQALRGAFAGLDAAPTTLPLVRLLAG